MRGTSVMPVEWKARGFTPVLSDPSETGGKRERVAALNHAGAHEPA